MRVNIMRAFLTCVCDTPVRATLLLDNQSTRITSENEDTHESFEVCEDRPLSAFSFSSILRNEHHRMPSELRRLQEKNKRRGTITSREICLKNIYDIMNTKRVLQQTYRLNGR